MDLRQLECFVRVAELGSFTKASAMLGISQSILSRQVRRLELDVKKHLLHRNGRGVTMTDHGRRLLAHGRGILHQLDLARQELEDTEHAPAGKIVIGMPPTAGKLLAVRAVTEFRARFPQASIGIVEGLTTTMQEWLMLGRIDCALLYNPAPVSGLDYQDAGAEKLYLISRPPAARRSETVRLADIAGLPLIIPSRPNALRTFIEAEFERRRLPLNAALEIDSIPAVIDLVARGLGHAILSRHAIRDHALQRKLHAARITSPEVVSRWVIATATQRPLTRLAQHTIDLLKAVIAQELSADATSPARAVPDAETGIPAT
ncbi:MAG: LysR family transcriptional regulator [Burkholderiales bacterium]|jgi:LysR family nitrogen assimilation transcriptional regulator|nr:LysR family transcriptional regulator [Burkholderiales bacterium]